MHVAVIGAGAAGLNAVKTAVASGFQCTVFEQTEEIGGTWVYTDQIGNNEYGMPIHTSMYQGLRSNLPKEIMRFTDFPVPECNLSYLPHEDVLHYLQSYADHFQLKQYIKFHRTVTHVCPLPEHRWKLTVMDVRTKEEHHYEFDAVMVCNGHYFKPRIPELHGIERFLGQQMHSHDFRQIEQFSGQTVVVVGAGPSGLDLSLLFSNTAHRVFLSHHQSNKVEFKVETEFPNQIISKPDIVDVTERTVVFENGSEEMVDVIFYCTGFDYTFPFLSEDCGITVRDNYIQPLYKHLVNIDHPTMALVGLPFFVCVFLMIDVQVQFFVEILKDLSKLPSKQEMLTDMEYDYRIRLEKGLSKRQIHTLGDFQESYYDSLASIANLKRLKPVYIKIYEDRKMRAKDDIKRYRGDIYKIIDDDTFTVVRGNEDMY